MYHLISSSTNLYWPSTSQYRHIPTQYHQVPLIIHHLMSHAQYTWSSFSFPSHSRNLGTDFFIPFSFPNIGNGLFQFPSRSRTLKIHSRSPLIGMIFVTEELHFPYNWCDHHHENRRRHGCTLPRWLAMPSPSSFLSFTFSQFRFCVNIHMILGITFLRRKLFSLNFLNMNWSFQISAYLWEQFHILRWWLHPEYYIWVIATSTR